jgi:hypothetical protein
MTGLVRKASILVALGLLLTAAAAMAGIPDAAHCTIPTFLDVFACKAGVADPFSFIGSTALPAGYGNGAIVIKDIGGNPVPGCDVKICFCADVKLYNQATYDAVYPGHGVVIDCVNNCITAVTDSVGKVYFPIIGAGKNSSAAGYPPGAVVATPPQPCCICFTVFACNIFVGQGASAIYDEDGVTGTKGVGPSDLAAWLKDFGKVIKYCRSDFSHDCTLGAADLAKWLKVFGLGNSVASCGTLCP